MSPALLLDIDQIAERWVAGLESYAFENGDVDGAYELVVAVERAYHRALRAAKSGRPAEVVRLSRAAAIEHLASLHGYVCSYCDRELSPFAHRSEPNAIQVDHMTPRCEGGTDDLDNLTLACPSCNRAKGARTVTEFLRGAV